MSQLDGPSMDQQFIGVDLKISLGRTHPLAPPAGDALLVGHRFLPLQLWLAVTRAPQQAWQRVFFFFYMDLVDLHSFTLVSLSQATQNALP